MTSEFVYLGFKWEMAANRIEINASECVKAEQRAKGNEGFKSGFALNPV